MANSIVAVGSDACTVQINKMFPINQYVKVCSVADAALEHNLLVLENPSKYNMRLKLHVLS